MTEKKSAQNMDLRIAMKLHGVPFWKLADALNVSEVTVYRKFRHELPDDQKKEIMKIIEKLD